MARQTLVPLVLPADPAGAMEAAPKQYVDAHPGFNFMQDSTPTATAVQQTWFQTATGYSYIWTGSLVGWVQYAPGGGGGAGSGFTFVSADIPIPEDVGDTWFNISDGPLGGTSSVAVDRGDGVLIWVQFSPGGGGGGGGGGTSVEPPIGSITEFINVIPPDRWLVLEGQTLVGGQHTHPALWDAIPDTMKVGEDIVFPDTRGRGSMGYSAADPLFDAVGKVGGSAHAVVASHYHTGSTGYVSADHAHASNINSGNISADHSHYLSANTGGFSANHVHSDTYGYNAGGQASLGTGFAGFYAHTTTNTGWANVDHVHGTNASTGTMSAHHWHNVNGATGGINMNHTHAVTVDANGVDPTNANLQPFIVFPKIIRVL